MNPKVVLDTSALFSMEDVPPGIEAFTTRGVLEELEKYHDNRAVYLEHKLSIVSSSPQFEERVTEAAKRTGDIARLSPTDRGLLAVALELGAEIWTDDYSIQNIAKVLSMPYKAMGFGGIKKVVKWKYRCQGCGKIFNEQLPDCPICGSQLKTTRKK